MFARIVNSLRFPGLALAVMALGPLSASIAANPQQADSKEGGQAAAPANPHAQAPTDAEMRVRAQRLIANQHKDDDVFDHYERIERHTQRTGGANPRTYDEKTYRVVPTGGGSWKILLKDGGRPIGPQEYRRELEGWEDALETMLNPGDSRAQLARSKFEKKKHDRADLVNAMNDAFIPKWAGQETKNGHFCDVFELDPNPDFHPHNVFQDALASATARLWVDHDADQMVRGEAHITRDISFWGGIIGKLNRGSVFSMDQEEIAPGVWMPTRYQYDFSGRKFLFSFEMHQLVEAGHYRYIGSTKDALALVQNELASGTMVSGDP